MSEQPETDSPVGAPSKYTPEIGERIAEMLADDKSLRYCASKLGLGKSTIHGWLLKHAEFADLCARAREAQALVIYDDLRSLERKVTRGALDPQAANVVLGNKRWRAERANRKHFGNAQKLEHTGADGGPIQTKSEVTMTKEDAYKAMLG